MGSTRFLNSFLLVFVVIAVLTSPADGWAERSADGGAPVSVPGPNDRLPVDPMVRTGRFDNGLTWYVRANHKPEDRLELRLVVKAGSVEEGEEQRGLAHFCEHMAFNGTKNFEKQELVDYLESIGMRFGPDLNAYTSFDETVYMLQVPTDSLHIMETAFQILEDWAHNISFDDGEIDKERGVIVEEWRLGRGADARMRDRQLPVLFEGSKYAERLPIGEMDVIRNFEHDTLRRFYRDWYRPDLMAVIAVGDADPDRLESLIRRHFEHIGNPGEVPELDQYPIPDHEEPRFSIVTDPEATSNTISIYYKHDATDETTVSDYRTSMTEALYNGMFTLRLNELARSADPPFLAAYSGTVRYVQPNEHYILAARVSDNGIERGARAILTEAARVHRHGFTATELARQKENLLRSMEQAYAERDKTESRAYVDEYTRNFLENEPMPGIEMEYALYRAYLDGITLDEVNGVGDTWITSSNRVVLVDAPEKDDIQVPGEATIEDIMRTVADEDVEPYVDEVSDEPLVDVPPSATDEAVVDTEARDDIGVTEATLSNGIRLILKPTDFKNDEVVFAAFSPGGTSLVPDDEYIPAVTATSIVTQSGAGPFSLTELQKKLAGKVVDVSPWIDETHEGLAGSVSPRDMETLFQLIHLYITEPRRDEEAYRSFLSRMKGFVENRNARPETAFQDTLATTLADYDYRARPWSAELLGEMDLDESFDVYRDRFADTSDFTFVFVGAFEPDSLLALAARYLDSLPGLGRDERWRDLGIDPPEGVVQKTVERGIEPKSRVSIVFNGTFDWSRRNRYLMNSVTDVLRIRLREVLREDMGGTYGVGVSPSVQEYPDREYKISVSFGCAPDRVEALTEAVFAQIDSIRAEGADEEYLTKVRETQRREYETNLRENGYWLSALQFYAMHGEDPGQILTYPDLVDGLSSDDIRGAARRWFDAANYVKVVLYPEEGVQ